ncbi:hypothetical protein HDV06_006099 [Boothiomyces sp. JEL0866]|nr:hypothetical protein HDV06_006049 [Boothiomyces sp. JEL0866]KAJ3324841.1 hypothetical protein HDV06_006099 [Boothiomyces sp. JEL0866]
MPCILKYDAYVEVKFAELDAVKTQICRKTLNPVWNQDFRLEIHEDSDLQNEPLELVIMDYDQITYNDAIGTVFVDLNPLLTWDSTSQISGWFPIYDTLLGIRGELKAQIKLQFFGDINPFKDSSAGVQFFSTPILPPGYQIVSILGFVSALDNEDDPEYHWTDNFRTPRKSNNARTMVMYRLAGQIRRLLGKKVLELNGNGLIGYKQYFDREADKKSITVRAIGTAIKIAKTDVQRSREVSIAVQQPIVREPSIITPKSVIADEPVEKQLELRDDVLEEIALPQPALQISPSYARDPVFLTVTQLLENVVVGTGGLVCAASIKILDNDEKDIREAWWTELRDEMKSHARTLGCNHIAGYSEQTSISDEIVLLFCSGTAVNIDISSGQFNTKSDDLSPINGIGHLMSPSWISQPSAHVSQEQVPLDGEPLPDAAQDTLEKKAKKIPPHCRSCHISYNSRDSPFPMALIKCGVCNKKYVPEVLLMTTEPYPEMKTIGNWVLIEAHVCRPKKIKVGETRATQVSESIPFAQYDIHRQLMYKLRLYGFNAIFGLNIQVSVGENMITAIATGTATYLLALPTPPPLKVFRNIDSVNEESQRFDDTQKKLLALGELNRAQIEESIAAMKVSDKEDQSSGNVVIGEDQWESDSSTSEKSETDTPAVTQSRLQQKAMVIEIDDEHDEDLVHFLNDISNENFRICNTEVPPLSKYTFPEEAVCQMVTMIRQTQIGNSNHPNRDLANVFKTLYQELAFQMSFLSPCTVTGLKYDVQLPKENCIQVILNAMVIGKNLVPEFNDDVSSERIVDTPKGSKELEKQNSFKEQSPIYNRPANHSRSLSSALDKDSQMSYPSSENLEEDLPEPAEPEESLANQGSIKDIARRLSSIKEYFKYSQIELSPLSYVPNTIFIRFLGRISFHFIKETNLVFDPYLGSSGMGGFTHVFMKEITAVIKSYVLCLGGNAVTGFNIDQSLFTESIKNQGYALISVSGDVVDVKYQNQEIFSDTQFME